MRLKKARGASHSDVSKEWVLEGKREKVSRFTQTRISQVGVVNILKANMYSLQDGEPSVFDKETTSRALTAAANGEEPYRRRKVRDSSLFCSAYFVVESLIIVEHERSFDS